MLTCSHSGERSSVTERAPAAEIISVMKAFLPAVINGSIRHHQQHRRAVFSAGLGAYTALSRVKFSEKICRFAISSQQAAHRGDHLVDVG